LNAFAAPAKSRRCVMHKLVRPNFRGFEQSGR
jgi:hypothetical protein